MEQLVTMSPQIIAVLLAGATVGITLLLYLLLKQFSLLRDIGLKLDSQIEINRKKSEKPPINADNAKRQNALYQEADLIRSSIQRYLDLHSENQLQSQNSQDASLLNNLESRISNYLDNMSRSSISSSIRKIIVDYQKRIKDVNRRTVSIFPTPGNNTIVIDLDTFLDLFPTLLSQKRMNYSGVIHAYLDYLARHFVVPGQSPDSVKETPNEIEAIKTIDKYIINDIIEKIDNILWDSQNYEESKANELIQFEKTVISPFLDQFGIHELPAIPGQTLIDIKFHDVLGKQESNFPTGIITEVYRRGFKYDDPKSNKPKIMKKAVVYIAG